MAIKLGEIELSDEAALAFGSWLDELVERRRRALAKVEEEKRQDALDSERHDKLTAIAREWAEKHGAIEWMDTYAQAEAAYTSWEQGAGHLDVDEHFQLDAGWRESWLMAYVSHVEELKRSSL